jgi:hypothetical protein
MRFNLTGFVFFYMVYVSFAYFFTQSLIEFFADFKILIFISLFLGIFTTWMMLYLAIIKYLQKLDMIYIPNFAQPINSKIKRVLKHSRHIRRVVNRIYIKKRELSKLSNNMKISSLLGLIVLICSLAYYVFIASHFKRYFSWFDKDISIGTIQIIAGFVVWCLANVFAYIVAVFLCRVLTLYLQKKYEKYMF